MNAEKLIDYEAPIAAADGKVYLATACGARRDDGLWEGWFVLAAVGGDEVLETGRETLQPNRTDLVYWATGISPVFLEGALVRARDRVARDRRARASA